MSKHLTLEESFYEEIEKETGLKPGDYGFIMGAFNRFSGVLNMKSANNTACFEIWRKHEDKYYTFTSCSKTSDESMRDILKFLKYELPPEGDELVTEIEISK